MMIEKLNVTSPVANIQNTTRKGDLSSLNSHDCVTLSNDAQKLAEVHLAIKTAKMANDIRVDKVDEMKAKFANPSYMDSVIDGLADSIMDAYGLLS